MVCRNQTRKCKLRPNLGDSDMCLLFVCPDVVLIDRCQRCHRCHRLPEVAQMELISSHLCGTGSQASRACALQQGRAFYDPLLFTFELRSEVERGALKATKGVIFQRDIRGTHTHRYSTNQLSSRSRERPPSVHTFSRELPHAFIWTAEPLLLLCAEGSL